MTWAGVSARMWEMRNVYKVLVGKLKRRAQIKNLSAAEEIVLNDA
jgi:hypothetical protein